MNQIQAVRPIHQNFQDDGEASTNWGTHKFEIITSGSIATISSYIFLGGIFTTAITPLLLATGALAIVSTTYFAITLFGSNAPQPRPMTEREVLPIPAVKKPPALTIKVEASPVALKKGQNPATPVPQTPMPPLTPFTPPIKGIKVAAPRLEYPAPQIAPPFRAVPQAPILARIEEEPENEPQGLEHPIPQHVRQAELRNAPIEDPEIEEPEELPKKQSKCLVVSEKVRDLIDKFQVPAMFSCFGLGVFTAGVTILTARAFATSEMGGITYTPQT